MKALTTLFALLVFSCLIFGQNYMPFNSPTKFTEVGGNNEVFFFAEETNVNGNITDIKQSQVLSSSYTTVDTNFCIADDTTGFLGDENWLGRNLIYDAQNRLLTVDGSFNFNFNQQLGDSALIYADNSNEYYLKFVSNTEELVFNQMDSVQAYSITHYDLQGANIPNNYSATPVKLSKSFGIINFINLSNSLQVEQEYIAAGQLNNSIGHVGNYGLTYNEAFPWDDGDTLQYRGKIITPIGHETSYLSYIITGRVETADSVFISYDLKKYYIKSEYGVLTEDTISTGFNIEYNSTIRYEKNKVISAYPIGRNIDGIKYLHDTLGELGLIENNFGSIEISGNGHFYLANYCDSCSCFPINQLFLMNHVGQFYYEDFGLAKYSIFTYGDADFGRSAELYYARVGNETFGDEYAALTTENPVLLNFELYPNPATTEIKVIAPANIERIDIYAASGQLCLSQKLNSTNSKLNIANLGQGVYIVKLTFANGLQATQRISKM